MQELRRIFTLIFIALYALVCSLVIGYSFCSIFKPRAKGPEAKNGFIALSSSPIGATIYLKDNRYTRNTPAIIRDIVPGRYKVKLSLKGYKPWREVVSVRSNTATVYENILLIPQKWQKYQLTSGSVQSFIPLSFGEVFILVNGSYLEDYLIYDLQRDIITPLIPSGSPYRGWKVAAHFTMPQSRAILFCLESYTGKKFLWLREVGKSINLEDLSSLFPEYPLKVIWDYRDPSYLFSFQSDYINILDITQRKIYSKYFERARGFGIDNRNIYAIKDITTILRRDYYHNTEETISDDPVLGNFIFGKKGFFEVKVLLGEIILFLGENGELTSIQLPHRFADEGVLGIKCHPATGRVLYWQKNRISYIDFSAMTLASTRQRKTGRIVLDVVEGGAPNILLWDEGNWIEEAFWVFEGTHFLLKDQDKVLLFELIARKESVINLVVRVKEDAPIFYSEPLGRLYFIDPNTGKFFYIEIIPRGKTVVTPFPDLK